MENSLKQRIVGAVVLIALAVIFLPAILKEKNQKADFESQIPVRPLVLTEHPLDLQASQQNEQTSAKLTKAEQESVVIKEKLTISSDESEALQKSAEKPESLSGNEKVDSKVNGETVETETSKETIEQQFKDAAWVIQVASFSNRENAEKLVLKLKSSNYKAYRRDGKNTKGQSVYRIYVGPYIEKTNANKQLDLISKISESKAILLVFDPVNH